MIACLKRCINPLAVWLLLPGSLAAADADARREQARQLESAGELRQTRALYQALAEAHPDDPADQLALGRVLLGLGQAYAATRPLETAVTLAPDETEAWRLLRDAYLRSGQSERAYTTLQAARSRFGELPWMQSPD